MAWTTPRTWTDGELVNASIMNVHVRDNLNAIGNHFHIRKTVATSTASDATVNDDPHLTFAVAASTVWAVRIVASVTCGAGGFRHTMTGPAGSSGFYASVFNSIFGSATALAGERFAAGTFTTEPLYIDAICVNAGTAGSFRLQWAQQASNAANTTVDINSFLIAHQIA